jgi:putative SOS response-associated peptidase YedK
MCGRFARINTAKEIKEFFNLDQIEIELQPSYNIAPTQDVAVIIENRNSKLTAMRWGLIPFWAKDITIGSKLINARGETIEEKPSFKYSFQKRRCLIVANGFYEWQKRGSNKFPYFIHLKDNKPFCFAGIYDNWKSPDSDRITSCSIITTDAIKSLKNIHPRMPVILSENNFSLWFNNNINALKQLLIPYQEHDLDFYEVSTDVNSTANNYPDLIEPSQDFFQN